MTNKRKIINDPVYGFLTIEDELIFDLISHPWFQRQRRIKQLGFSYLVYPGAMHTRFSHMLGALNLMNRALEVLQTKGVEITPDECLAARIAILLHDIGHGPFSHISEHLLVEVDHETISEIFLERLIDEFQSLDSRTNTQTSNVKCLEMALSIFRDEYPKRFLHQLVSSQLDMDRLDYLSRDSFFTGVSEGIVGTERIINMLNVANDELVVDEKGIYSIEKFIISRRLMYWQVYLHKTVIAADTLLLSLLRRARQLMAEGSLASVQQIENWPLLQFLEHTYGEDDFRRRPELLDLFAAIDDDDVMVALKRWQHHPDRILSTLSEHLLNRHLNAIRISDHPFATDEIEALRQRSQERFDITPQESEYFVGTGMLKNHAYNFNDQEIKVLFKDGTCRDISEASDQLDHHFLEKQVTKYYVFCPKDL